MTIGPHTLELAAVLVAEKRLEAEIARRWRIAPASGIASLGRTVKKPGSPRGKHRAHRRHRGVAVHRGAT